MNFFRTAIILFFAVFACANLTAAQTFPAPREEKLLNGLKMLIWTDSQNPKVTVKVRIHSGAAFDPKDKMGTMALLGDILFPSEQTKEFFAEDLEGGLDVETNYDYIQITAIGKAEEIQTILETIAAAVSNPQITPENFKLVRDARFEKVKELEKNPYYTAARIVSQRLYGDFPYGKSAGGTSESLAKIDRPDLMLAAERFLTADNTTMTISGNVKAESVYRISRQLFGAWKKTETKVPATFRQPDAPTAGKDFVEYPNYENADLFQASRGVSRNSKDFEASRILADVLAERLKTANPAPSSVLVRSEPHLLFGTFIVKATVPADKALAFSTRDKNSFLKAVSDAEFQQAKSARIAEQTKLLTDPLTLADAWLDVDTYKLAPVAQQLQNLQNLSLADVNNVLETVLKKSPSISISVGDPVKLRDFLAATQPPLKEKN